jgi:hypothetical protein
MNLTDFIKYFMLSTKTVDNNVDNFNITELTAHIIYSFV